jgi:RHS repeat-associated protein
VAHVWLFRHGLAGSRLSNLPGLKIQTWATPNGNVIGTANGNSYVYDSESHMISMTNGSKSVTMMYDAFGNRVSKTVTTAGVPTTTQYLVDDLNPTGYPQVLDELTGPIGSAAVSRTYTYGLQRISQVQIANNELSYYQYDGGGSVRQLTNSSGVMTDSYEYDAFGNSFTKTGTTPNNYLYRGEQYDSDLGLYYLRARYYNPTTGRFLSRDPINHALKNSNDLHRYLYADGDPVNGFDPTGRGTVGYLLKSIAVYLVTVPEAGELSLLTVACIAGVADFIYEITTKNEFPNPFGAGGAVLACATYFPKAFAYIFQGVPWP